MATKKKTSTKRGATTRKGKKPKKKGPVKKTAKQKKKPTKKKPTKKKPAPRGKAKGAAKKTAKKTAKKQPKKSRNRLKAKIKSQPRKRAGSESSKKTVLKKPTRPMKFIRTIKDIKKHLGQIRSRRQRVALVPTMGYLHEGHLSLIREARRLASVVVSSVFVNPTQFSPSEDLDRYPRDLSGDKRKLKHEGVTIMFAPDTAEIYPEGFQTYVDVTEVTRDYCGATRPGHFRGVTSIVNKMFNIVKPDVAIFGQKDYQQLVAIRQMVRDLSMEVDVVGMPTLREEDGLAMSSRNAYLSPSQRQQATAIFRGLRKAKRLLDSGERDSAELAAVVLDLLREEQDIRVEYVSVCDPETLERIPEVESSAILLVAIRIAETRLIDNIRLDVRKSRRRR
jgi:pantoate--beta-alanine ligase